MINIENLDFSYRQTRVFSHISLEFRPGSVYGLLGENGVGKTTLLKIIAGLQRPSAGSCTVDGQHTFQRSPDFLQSICFLPDEVTLPETDTPQRYVDALAPFYPSFSQDDFRAAMDTFQVDPSVKFKTMSYGQQKKSLIACALALNTRYLLLDEPTNGLDIPSKTQFRSFLAGRVDGDSTIVISTHQVKDVENLIDPLIILNHDDVLVNASVEAITSKLLFEYATAQRPDALYSEMRPGGYLNVCVNTDGSESVLDIEALFNTVLRNKDKVKALFAGNATKA